MPLDDTRSARKLGTVILYTNQCQDVRVYGDINMHVYAVGGNTFAPRSWRRHGLRYCLATRHTQINAQMCVGTYSVKTCIFTYMLLDDTRLPRELGTVVHCN